MGAVAMAIATAIAVAACARAHAMIHQAAQTLRAGVCGNVYCQEQKDLESQGLMVTGGLGLFAPSMGVIPQRGALRGEAETRAP
jgi:hypothetical protein